MLVHRSKCLLLQVFGKNDKAGNSRSPSRDVPRSSYDLGQQGDEQGRVSKGQKKTDTLTEQDLKRQLEQLQSVASNMNANNMSKLASVFVSVCTCLVCHTNVMYPCCTNVMYPL